MTDIKKKIEEFGIDGIGLRDFAWGDSLEDELKILKVVSEDPVTRFYPHFYNLSREDQFRFNIQRAARMKQLAYEGKVPHVDMKNYGTFSMAINSLYPTSVHHGMFESIIKVLGTDEQVDKVWDDIVAYKIIGCYAQTEIGHGSDVQGLMTQAIYDEENEEFIINSPSVKAYKFWPGDLGKMANHGCVFCRLIIKGEDYGVHAFLIRIRDQYTHAPMKGVEIGDIGPKFGYSYKDNGYMKFDNYRVPRSSILSRYVGVEKDGNISIKGDPRVAYATMLWIRVQLLFLSWHVKFSCLSTTSRYALKRSQFKTIHGSDVERKIFDYQATQHLLVPATASSYAVLCIGKFCMEMFNQMNEEIKSDNFSTMNDLHVLISCLKAYFMDDDISTLYQLREIMGGHGYHSSANIPGWIEAWSANVTLEGDTFVLYQQTARKLIKILNGVLKGKTVNK